MIDFAIFYEGKTKEVRGHGFIDSDWAVDIDGRQLTIGYVFRLFRGESSWMSRRQSIVALSTKKNEYMETTHANTEAVWLK